MCTVCKLNSIFNRLLDFVLIHCFSKLFNWFLNKLIINLCYVFVYERNTTEYEYGTNKRKQIVYTWRSFHCWLTTDDGMNKSYGRWIEYCSNAICPCECCCSGSLLTLPLSQHSSSVFFSIYMCVCVHVWEWAQLCNFFLCLLRLLCFFSSSSFRFTDTFDCVSIRYCCFRLLYAGVLLQGSACFYHALRYGHTLFMWIWSFDWIESARDETAKCNERNTIKTEYICSCNLIITIVLMAFFLSVYFKLVHHLNV